MMIVSALHDPIIVWDMAQKVERKRRDPIKTVETREYIEDMQRLIDFIREETADQDELEEAREEGYDDGYEKGQDEFNEDSYDQGYREGKRDGHEEGEREGFEKGKEEALEEGYNRGFEAGKAEGHGEGHSEGYDQGWNQAILYLEEVCAEMRADAIAKALNTDVPEAMNHL
jgi:flagellar biosynthesis/type III secretory pathway protein FliH